MDKTISFTNNTNSIVTSNRILYTPSSFARSSLLTLQEIGTLEALKPHTSSRDNLQSFLFFYVESSAGMLVYQGKVIVFLLIASFHTLIPRTQAFGRFLGSISMAAQCRGFMRSIWNGVGVLYLGRMIWNLSSHCTKLSTTSPLLTITSGYES